MSPWEDLDQTWYLATLEHLGSVYVFQSELDRLTSRVDGTVHAEAGEGPGRVRVAGIDSAWHCIPEAAFRAAWARAQGQARRIVAGRGG